ncbi:COMPASS complex protein [Gymnopilus junonius]|uniref:COMPASS complex protein n=1 Tax=Gymnopilus junonius TaxID=109634 RepID=A0A9P5NC94_GYMJU|nr:COMPASS complex protein [Gymnopilus junonius]
MNESLINPFTLSHPTAVQTSFFAGALFARFDATGRFIAAARLNGPAEIWDLETRAPIRWLDGHVKSITSIDWSRNSRYLLTSSKDWNVLVWDLASTCDPPQRHNSIRFDAPVVSSSFHPNNSQIILVLLATGEAYVCDLRKQHKSRVELDEDESNGQGPCGSSPITTARFDPTGKNIFVGTAAGYLLVFNTRTKTMIARHKISGAGAMKGLEFTKSGRRLVTNSSDRTLRQFILPTYSPLPTDAELQHHTYPPFLDVELEPTHRFNDPINKTAWHAMSYSPDGDWLAGGSADPSGHKIYIWDISNDGQLASALDGGREPLVYLHWHPAKSSLASTTNQGSILIWHHPNPERWGAFAGGFEEVDENVQYEEREDEFDIEDEAVLHERKMKAEEEEVDIDTVVTGAEAAVLGGKGAQSDNKGGATTPVGNGISHFMDTDKLGSVGLGDDLIDVETAWAEEDPDGDTPGGWKMKVIMEDEAADYY